MISFLLSLKLWQAIFIIILLISINLGFTYLVKTLVNKEYEKNASIDKALYLEQRLMHYISSLIMIITSIFIGILLISHLKWLKNYDLLGALIIVYIVCMLTIICENQILFSLNKKLRNTSLTRKEQLLNFTLYTGFTLFIILLLIFIMKYKPFMASASERIQNYISTFIPALLFLFFMLLYPLFLRFFIRPKSFENEPLYEELNKFIESTKIKHYKLYSWPAKSSKHANAMISGLIFKNIYISDYLLENFTIDEIKAVLAHEISHLKKHHLIERVISILLIFIAIPVMGILIDNHEEILPNFPIYNMIIIFLIITIAYVLFLIFFVQRWQEKQADLYTLQMNIEPKVYIDALIKLSKLNNLTINLNKVDEKLLSHPSFGKRIEYICKYSNISYENLDLK